MRRILLFLAVLCLAFAPAPLPRPERERAIEIRLDPVRLGAHDLTADDVEKALMPSGIVGDAGHAEQVVWRGAYLLELFGTPAQPLRWGPEQFGNVIIRATADGEIVRLKDVARLRLRTR